MTESAAQDAAGESIRATNPVSGENPHHTQSAPTLQTVPPGESGTPTPGTRMSSGSPPRQRECRPGEAASENSVGDEFGSSVPKTADFRTDDAQSVECVEALSIAELVRHTGLTPDEAREAQEGLISAGWLTVVREGSAFSPAILALTIPGDADE